MTTYVTMAASAGWAHGWTPVTITGVCVWGGGGQQHRCVDVCLPGGPGGGGGGGFTTF
jgi:hypothetical protein